MARNLPVIPQPTGQSLLGFTELRVAGYVRSGPFRTGQNEGNGHFTRRNTYWTFTTPSQLFAAFCISLTTSFMTSSGVSAL